MNAQFVFIALRDIGKFHTEMHDISSTMEGVMNQLLRTYLVGEDRKYELYGDIDAGERVTKVLEYAYRSLEPELKTAQWVCLGPVDISEFKDKNMDPYLYGVNVKNNDIATIRQFCIERAKR